MGRHRREYYSDVSEYAPKFSPPLPYIIIWFRLESAIRHNQKIQIPVFRFRSGLGRRKLKLKKQKC